MQDLREAIDRTGYYPEVVADGVTRAVADEEVVSYFVHHEPTFDRDEVRRHLTVVVLTPSRLILAHTDEHDPDDLLPDHLPSIGLLDDALLVDLALQTLRDELADYEDFCQFRHVAADFARVGDADTGLTRGQWQQALHQARGSSQWQGDGVLQFPHNNGDRLERNHGLRRGYVADPRVSLFHIS